MSRPRVGVACVFHESNTAIARATTVEDCRRGRTAPHEMLDALAGTQTATGGFIDRGREIFELVPLVHYWLVPSGRVQERAFGAMADELEDAIAGAGPLDGLLLELHGAMTAEGHARADAELAARARRAVGASPIAAVIDPHANVSPGLCATVDALLAYQANPHVDMADRGRRGADLLAELVAGLQASIAAVPIPIVAPAIAQATADEPLATLVAAAREREAADGIAAASIAFGFAYADVPDLGMTAVVVGHDHDAAERAACELAALCWELRERFRRELFTPEEAVEQAGGLPGLTALADTGDNVGGGAPGDSSALAEVALAAGLRTVTTIRAPETVRAAAAAGTGAVIDVTLGSPPLRLDAVVRAVRAGVFRADGPLYAGLEFDMGTVAVLDAGSLTVIAQTHAVPPNDPALFRAVGADLEATDAVVLKGAAALRAGWASTAHHLLDVATPGPTTSDVRELEIHSAPRPLWPLEDFEWSPPPRRADRVRRGH